MTIFQNIEGLSLHEPLFSKEGDFLFLTLKDNDRIAIATTIERLIDKLDAMDTDCDLEDTGDDEPSLCEKIAPQGEVDLEADHCDDEPWLGSHEIQFERIDYHYAHSTLTPSAAPLGSQASWASGGDDDREYEDEREDGCDDEKTLGWSEEDTARGVAGFASDDQEPSLGWTDHADQTHVGQHDPRVWWVEDGEPEFGWCENAGMGIAAGEPCDDREGEDERDDDGDFAEHFLGWGERCSQGADNPALLMSGMDPDEGHDCSFGFAGVGIIEAKRMLAARA